MGMEIASEIMQEHPEYTKKADQGNAAPPPPPPSTGIPRGQRVDQEVQSAKLIKKVDPVYPPLAKAARIQGTVQFTALIGKDGKVQNLTLVRGHPLLVNAAKEAVLQWEYEPTVIDGKPVEVITDVTVTFHLDANPG